VDARGTRMLSLPEDSGTLPVARAFCPGTRSVATLTLCHLPGQNARATEESRSRAPPFRIRPSAFRIPIIPHSTYTARTVRCIPVGFWRGAKSGGDDHAITHTDRCLTIRNRRPRACASRGTKLPRICGPENRTDDTFGNRLFAYFAEPEWRLPRHQPPAPQHAVRR
jgi:hypothetical protein